MNLFLIIAIVLTVTILTSVLLFSFKPFRYKALPSCCVEHPSEDIRQAPELYNEDENQFLNIFRKNVLKVLLEQEFVAVRIDRDYEISVDIAEHSIFKAHENNSFKAIRNRFGYTVKDFEDALSKPLTVQDSDGKSKSIFLYSACKRFIFKSTRRREHLNLIEWLPDYLKHLQTYPNSLLPRYLGLYSIDVVYSTDSLFSTGSYNFVMMHNWFFNVQGFNPIIKFDFKGSWVGRQSLSFPELDEFHKNGFYSKDTALSSITLKEIDYKYLADKRYLDRIKMESAFRFELEKQLECDVNCLVKNGFMDYSILVGIHKLTEIDERVDVLYRGRGDEIYFFGLIDTLQTFTVNKWLEKKVKKSQSCLRSVWSSSGLSRQSSILDLSVEIDEISVEEPVRYGKRLLEFFHHL